MSRIEVALKLRDELMEQFITSGDCNSDDVCYYEMIMDSLSDVEYLAYEAVGGMSLN